MSLSSQPPGQGQRATRSPGPKNLPGPRVNYDPRSNEEKKDGWRTSPKSPSKPITPGSFRVEAKSPTRFKPRTMNSSPNVSPITNPYQLLYPGAFRIVLSALFFFPSCQLNLQKLDNQRSRKGRRRKNGKEETRVIFMRGTSCQYNIERRRRRKVKEVSLIKVDE